MAEKKTKKLFSETFDRAYKLCRFINENGISKTDMQILCISEGGVFTLFYWAEEPYFYKGD